ncbi:MAG TPA: molecular chaperone HtpG [Nevskiaceae bacterium]|nr:molecular chaperone HtpG [Nevskiaceae bacterium]
MTAERRAFQAETQSLLRLMIHSLYSNKEIFLRELISNASDACDKLRFLALSQPELRTDSDELAIELIPDAKARTLTLRDNGIGMSRDEVIDNLGTIARSGTRRFMEQLSGDQARDAQLIGQFGVGFYSAFIVAEEVVVRSRRAGSEEAVEWRSRGEGEFEVQTIDKPSRGTEIVLHLREEDAEFAETSRIGFIVRKYSDHIGFPVRLINEQGEADTLNQASAFWMRPKAELKDEDYQAFYQHLSKDFEPALAWTHAKVEGTLEYTTLLYLPQRAPFELWNREQHNGVQLYVKRVFIMDKAAELLPPWLRFVRGLVDTADLPLNVSREILQGNRNVEKIKAALTKRVLDLLEDLASNRAEDYRRFWSTFGAVLKEGIIEDAGQRARIARLLRFASSGSSEPTVSLADYLARMPEGQKAIYFQTADTLAAARSSPHLEGYLKRGYEVLLLTDRIDEWLVSHLTEFEGKPLRSVAQGSGDLEDSIETAEKTQQQAVYAETLTRLGKALGGRIGSARLSTRLTESPACLVADDAGLSRRLEKLFQQSGEKFPVRPPVLEINADHPLVARLKDTADDGGFADLAEILYGQAVLAEGGALEQPGEFVQRLNRLLIEGLGSGSRLILTP